MCKYIIGILTRANDEDDYKLMEKPAMISQLSYIVSTDGGQVLQGRKNAVWIPNLEIKHMLH